MNNFAPLIVIILSGFGGLSACAQTAGEAKPVESNPLPPDPSKPTRWKADHTLLRQCLEKNPSRWQTPPKTEDSHDEGGDQNLEPSPNIQSRGTKQDGTRSTFSLLDLSLILQERALVSAQIATVEPNISASSQSWSFSGDGNLSEVIEGARRQEQICSRLLKRARERGKKHSLDQLHQVGSCSVNIGDWCSESARIVIEVASRLAEEQKTNPSLTNALIYSSFLNEISQKFDHAFVAGPALNDRKQPTDPETNVLMTTYYSPVLDASRVSQGEYIYPIFAAPKNIRYITIDGTGRKGWRVPDVTQGKWKRAPLRREIEGPTQIMKGSELVYLKDPLDRSDLHLQGSGVLRVAESDGSIRTRRVQFAGDNGYTNHPVAKIVRCELEQRGGEFTETYMGVTRVKPMYLGGRGLRTYLRDSEAPTWSKFDELIQETESIVFYKELENKGAQGLYGAILTPNVSLAGDDRIAPFGMPLILSRKKDGESSFLGFSQDAGGVVKGAHFDLYLGEGQANAQRGFRRFGTARLLLPKGCLTPPAPPAPAPAPAPTPTPPPQ